MSHRKLVIIKNISEKHQSNNDYTVIDFYNFREIIKKKTLGLLFYYSEVRLLTCKISVLSKPLLMAVGLRLLSRGLCYFQDKDGNRIKINVKTLVEYFWHLIRDFFAKFILLHKINNEINRISGFYDKIRMPGGINLEKSPIYLRTNLWFGIEAGGSVGHIAGVLNNFDNFTSTPVFLTTDKVPTVRNNIKTYLVLPDNKFWDFKELPSLHLNFTFEKNAVETIKNESISFIYQRYSLNNYCGIKLSRKFNVPFVLEYNGSEVWVAKNWGEPLKYQILSEKIEMLNLEVADLIVVVSKPIKDELIKRGFKSDKILVNPNGVDPDKYSPSVDGNEIREKYSLSGKIVIGFIGTFGKWHGAELLSEAFGMFMSKYPMYRDKVRLLMVGDGAMMPNVRENLNKYNISDLCILTGLVPQEQGPMHLAACDILASPHVPNHDGTPFFGSPTKLFEYMAMGKGIVASDLDQIGEVLKHNYSAFMVKPGDSESLMNGLKTLIDNEVLRMQLGKNARQEVVNKYTWREHTRRIVTKLFETIDGRNGEPYGFRIKRAGKELLGARTVWHKSNDRRKGR